MIKAVKKEFENMTLEELSKEYVKAVQEKNYARSAKIFEYVKANYKK